MSAVRKPPGSAGHPALVRNRAIWRVRGALERDGFPRLQMVLLVTVTGASGFVASAAMLHAGLDTMWVRYLAAFGIAYLVFLVLLWFWLRTKAEDYGDVPDISGSSSSSCPPSSSGSDGSCFSGHGGEFGGGGANGSFDAPAAEPPAPEDSGIVGDALGTVAEADELAIPLAALVIAAAVVFSSLYLIYAAPVLFAELMVDGVLSATLYRRLGGIEMNHWLETAVRRTALPFLMSAVVVSACGWVAGIHAPGARSIGEVVAGREPTASALNPTSAARP